PTPVPHALQAARALSAPTAQVAAPPATSVEADVIPTRPGGGAGVPWAWLIVLFVVVGASAAWVAIRRGR
ncbi:MAG TPA: hypothetical protein VLY63_04245, partial [Anaerolineae bacterium]|nr:hypothetical protein [Anaerolineae bacterium]